MCAERLVVESLQGVRLDELGRLRGYLGISLEKSNYFSKQRVRDYIRWSAGRLQGLMILVADHLETYNEQVLKQRPPAEALARALRRGGELAQGYRRAIPRDLDFPVEVHLASGLLETPACQGVLERVRMAADRSRAFRQDLEAAVRSNLDDPLDRERHRRVMEGMDALVCYLVEEIALILYLSCVREARYTVALFPYRPQPVISNVFDGGYGGLFSDITGSTPFQFIQLMAERAP